MPRGQTTRAIGPTSGRVDGSGHQEAARFAARVQQMGLEHFQKRVRQLCWDSQEGGECSIFRGVSSDGGCQFDRAFQHLVCIGNVVS